MSEIQLPRHEFDILAQDAVHIVLYDKVVDKLYEYDVAACGWHFPPGSRVTIIKKLTGLDLGVDA